MHADTPRLLAVWLGPARDDCWGTGARNVRGQLVEDPSKFPSGMRALAGSLITKGMLFGIVSSSVRLGYDVGGWRRLGEWAWLPLSSRRVQPPRAYYWWE